MSSAKDFWNAFAEARAAYSTGGIEGAGSLIKQLFDVYDARDGSMQARIHMVLHPMCGEQTEATLDGREKQVTCVDALGHSGPHHAFFPDTIWATPW